MKSVDRAWALAKDLARKIQVPSDPVAEGPLGVFAVQHDAVALRGRLTYLLGVVGERLAKAEGKLAMLKRSRAARADSLLSNAHNDPYLKLASPTVRKARIARQLADTDEAIGGLEDTALTLRPLVKYIEVVIDLSKSAKEVLRAQVDLLRDHRLLVREGEDGAFD